MLFVAQPQSAQPVKDLGTQIFGELGFRVYHGRCADPDAERNLKIAMRS